MDINDFKKKHTRSKSGSEIDKPDMSIPVFKPPLRRNQLRDSKNINDEMIEAIVEPFTSDIVVWGDFSSSLRRKTQTYEAQSISTIIRELNSKYHGTKYKKIDTNEYKTIMFANGCSGLEGSTFSFRILAKKGDLSPMSRLYLIENLASSTGLVLNDDEMEAFNGVLEKMLLMDAFNIKSETEETNTTTSEESGPSIIVCYDLIHGHNVDYKTSDKPTFRLRKEITKCASGKRFTWLISKVDTPEYIRFGSQVRTYMKVFSKVIKKLVHYSLHPLYK